MPNRTRDLALTGGLAFFAGVAFATGPRALPPPPSATASAASPAPAPAPAPSRTAGAPRAVSKALREGVGGSSGGEPPPGPRLSVTPGPGQVSIDRFEPVDPQVIASSIIRSMTRQLGYCYEKRRKVSPHLEGRVTLDWTVVEGEAADPPVVVANSTDDEDLAACVTMRVERWRFPPHFSGDLTWSFDFAIVEPSDTCAASGRVLFGPG